MENETSKSLTESFVLPISIAIIGAITTGVTAIIQTNHTKRQHILQNELSKRQTDVAIIKAVNDLANQKFKNEENIDLFLAGLSSYQQYSIPILVAYLKKQDLGSTREIVEHSLVDVALVYKKVPEVGESMINILRDIWSEYKFDVHKSALQILGSISYKDTIGYLKTYEPEKAIHNWDDLDEEEKNTFKSILKTCVSTTSIMKLDN